MPRHALQESRKTQRLIARALTAFEKGITEADGSLRVDAPTALALARLCQQQHSAWCRDRTIRGMPLVTRAPPRDNSKAGRAARAAAKRQASLAAPGLVAPLGVAPSADAVGSSTTALPTPDAPSAVPLSVPCDVPCDVPEPSATPEPNA